MSGTGFVSAASLSEVNGLSSSPLDAGYRLCLQNNQRWRIIGLDGMEGRAGKLASILGLRSERDGQAATFVLKRWNTAEKLDFKAAFELINTTELLPDGRRVFYPGVLVMPAADRAARKCFRPMILRVLLDNGTRHAIFEIDENPRYPSYMSDMSEHYRKAVEAKAELAVLRHVVYTLYRQSQDSGGIPLHSALAARDGKGVVLMGTGGAGKSTCYRRLPPPWEALCDDEVLVVRDEHRRFLGHPFPTWSNFRGQKGPTSWFTQRGVPMAAIFYLEQAEKDDVLPIGQGHAALLINQAAWQVWRGCSEALRSSEGCGQRSFGLQIVENACALARSVPAFTLRVSLTGRFWENIERVLSELPPQPR